MWATKVHSQLQTSLYDVNTTILETGREKERVYRGKYLYLKACFILIFLLISGFSDT